MSEFIGTIASLLKDYSNLVAIPGAAVVGAGVYRWQKATDRRSALVELRRKVYTEYLGAFFKIVEKNTPENNTNHNLKLMDLAAVASDQVVRDVGSMKAYLMDAETREGNKIDAAIARPLIASAILAMRKDCFETSTLSSVDVMKIIPIRP